ncbi:hypothetical protein, variant 5 [Aphanomyces astaci]|uniref:Uncharacterized protein n=1 Tax=Aphanomyces astaci TaxID=112090 RepID=W4FYB9_APHAT|nr:hypothetical protein, variant 5 [Aphanomyces astaci]ETV71966.1 hypothetical protein, variant 5 [Aphanomyces astaci]|eukprot:XP_009838410.1 hypothetical protein, variant 5 [Aphanomyces astaci]
MDEFADLKDGSGEWQNIQSVLRSTFQVLLESKVRQERRVAQLEQKMEELQLQVDQKADKAYVQRSIIQPHVPSSDYDTNNPSTSSGVNSTAKTVQVMQRQLIELEARFAAMSSVLLSNCPLYSMPIYVQCENERIIIGQDSELCLATERRVEYVEEELRLIVPIIDKKADVEAIHLWLGQANDSWKHAMKKRLKTTSFEREVQNWQAKLDQVECAGSLEHPDTKAQLHQLSSKLHQHEATLARLAYFIQKSPDQQVAIQNSMADLETKLQNTIVMIQAKQHINNDVLSPAGELGEPNDKLETTGSIAAMATKIQALETQVETVAQRGVATSSDQENLVLPQLVVALQVIQTRRDHPSTPPGAGRAKGAPVDRDPAWVCLGRSNRIGAHAAQDRLGEPVGPENPSRGCQGLPSEHDRAGTHQCNVSTRESLARPISFPSFPCRAPGVAGG